MARVYLETSFISACVETRADTASTRQRAESLEWWDRFRGTHECCVGTGVIEELSHPSYPNSAAALRWCGTLLTLEPSEQSRELVDLLLAARVFSPASLYDAGHVAVATVNQCEYLVTWNQRHLANPRRLDHLAVVCARARHLPPRVVTPDMMLGDLP